MLKATYTHSTMTNFMHQNRQLVKEFSDDFPVEWKFVYCIRICMVCGCVFIFVLVYSFRFGFQNDSTILSAPNFTTFLLITMGGISSAGSYQCTFCITLYQKWVGYVMRTKLFPSSSVSIFSSLCISLARIFIPLIQFGIFEENIPKVFTFESSEFSLVRW